MGYGQRNGKNGERNRLRCLQPYEYSGVYERKAYVGVDGWCLADYFAANRFQWVIAYEFDLPMSCGRLLLSAVYFERVYGSGFTWTDVLLTSQLKRGLCDKLLPRLVDSGAIARVSPSLFKCNPRVMELFDTWLPIHAEHRREAEAAFIANPPKRIPRKRGDKQVEAVLGEFSPPSEIDANSEFSLTANLRERPKSKELIVERKRKDSHFSMD